MSNPAYAGDYYFNRIEGKTGRLKPQGEWVRLVVEPIIDMATFQRTQARRASRAPAVVPPRVLTSPTLLTGLLKCGCCGAGMTLATGKGGRYRYYKCNTRIGKGIDYCAGGNVPMQKLDDLVLGSLVDRVFTGARVKLMLESLARRARDKHRHEHRQIEALNRELAAVTGGMGRLYEGIEKGLIKLDDTLRERTDQLQTQREAILTQIAKLKAPATLPANLLQQKHIDAFTALVRARFLENGPFAKQYLQLLVDEIRVNRQEVKLTGSYGAVAQAVAGNLDTPIGVPRFVPKWLPELGSNQRPADYPCPLFSQGRGLCLRHGPKPLGGRRLVSTPSARFGAAWFGVAMGLAAVRVRRL
jgi:hypothetical protein